MSIHLMPPNWVLKNGQNCSFCVMYILSQLKKTLEDSGVTSITYSREESVQEGRTSDSVTPQIHRVSVCPHLIVFPHDSLHPGRDYSTRGSFLFFFWKTVN